MLLCSHCLRHSVPAVQSFGRKLLYLDWGSKLNFIKICAYCHLIGLQCSRVKCIKSFYFVREIIKKCLERIKDFIVKIQNCCDLLLLYKSTVTVNHVTKYCNKRTCSYFPCLISTGLS